MFTAGSNPTYTQSQQSRYERGQGGVKGRGQYSPSGSGPAQRSAVGQRGRIPSGGRTQYQWVRPGFSHRGPPPPLVNMPYGHSQQTSSQQQGQSPPAKRPQVPVAPPRFDIPSIPAADPSYREGATGISDEDFSSPQYAQHQDLINLTPKQRQFLISYDVQRTTWSQLGINLNQAPILDLMQYMQATLDRMKYFNPWPVKQVIEDIERQLTSPTSATLVSFGVAYEIFHAY